MTLAPGTRLGSYEVVAAIGAGGMGEVYRATDSHLKRSVAIKVLPASVAGDTDRLARFQREAEVLAALNHPKIAAIYGIEKTLDFTALVMEAGVSSNRRPSAVAVRARRRSASPAAVRRGARWARARSRPRGLRPRRATPHLACGRPPAGLGARR